MYFKLFKLRSRGKRSVAQPQAIYSEFPQAFSREPLSEIPLWNGRSSRVTALRVLDVSAFEKRA